MESRITSCRVPVSMGVECGEALTLVIQDGRSLRALDMQQPFSTPPEGYAKGKAYYFSVA